MVFFRFWTRTFGVLKNKAESYKFSCFSKTPQPKRPKTSQKAYINFITQVTFYTLLTIKKQIVKIFLIFKINEFKTAPFEPQYLQI
jgi:hypothetical protein